MTTLGIEQRSSSDRDRDTSTALKTVLVVDDEEDIATYLASVLEDAGMRVLIASDGRQALELVASHRPDLISLDLVMPGYSGIRVLHELRRRREWSRIPVIVVTAHARDPEVRDDLESTLADSSMLGPSLYLEKPVTARSYLEAVCRVLGVDLPEESRPSASSQRDEAMSLLAGADPGTVVEVLAKLKKDS